MNIFKKLNVKSLALTVAMMLALTSAIGGTIAWIVAETDPVVNTFTYGDIDITLEETDADGDGDATANKYKMIPGNTIEKDPKVIVEGGSEDCWLFVKLEKSANFDTYLTYNPGKTWIDNKLTSASDDTTEVYYYEYTQSDDEQVYPVLSYNRVQVKEDVTKEQLNLLDTDGFPTLTITAYAVQKANIETVEEAWNAVNGI